MHCSLRLHHTVDARYAPPGHGRHAVICLHKCRKLALKAQAQINATTLSVNFKFAEADFVQKPQASLQRVFYRLVLSYSSVARKRDPCSIAAPRACLTAALHFCALFARHIPLIFWMSDRRWFFFRSLFCLQFNFQTNIKGVLDVSKHAFLCRRHQIFCRHTNTRLIFSLPFDSNMDVSWHAKLKTSNVSSFAVIHSTELLAPARSRAQSESGWFWRWR